MSSEKKNTRFSPKKYHSYNQLYWHIAGGRLDRAVSPVGLWSGSARLLAASVVGKREGGTHGASGRFVVVGPGEEDFPRHGHGC